MSNINCSVLAFNGSDHDVLINGVAMPFIVHYLKNCIAPGKRDISVHWPHYLPQSKCIWAAASHTFCFLCCYSNPSAHVQSAVCIFNCNTKSMAFLGSNSNTLFVLYVLPSLHYHVLCQDWARISRLQTCSSQPFVLINKGLYHMSRTGMAKKRNHAGVVIHYWRNIEPMKVVCLPSPDIWHTCQ